MAGKKDDSSKKDHGPKSGQYIKRDDSTVKKKDVVVPVKKDGGDTESTGPKRNKK
jgi:hypothetical protein